MRALLNIESSHEVLLKPHIRPKRKIQSKFFITSLFITEYSISDINLQGIDLFLLKFPLYNRIFT